MTYQNASFKPSLEDASDWLRKTYEVRKLRNPYYSQRAFAKHLGLPSGRLSEILLKRRLMTIKQLEKLSKNLNLDPEEILLLQNSVKQQKKSVLKEKTSRALLSKDSSLSDYSPVSEDVFATFADWYHLAILNLIKTKDFVNNPNWIAERLGISTKEASDAICRLERLRLIRKVSKKLVRSEAKLRTTTDIPSSAIRLHHKQQLNKAVLALDTIPVELRDISSMTMAVNLEKLMEAKEMIKNFRRLLSDFVEVGSKTEVYHLTISFCPLSKYLPKKESVV